MLQTFDVEDFLTYVDRMWLETTTLRSVGTHESRTRD